MKAMLPSIRDARLAKIHSVFTKPASVESAESWDKLEASVRDIAAGMTPKELLAWAANIDVMSQQIKSHAAVMDRAQAGLN